MWTRLLWACAVIWMLTPAVAHAQVTSPPLVLDETRRVLPLAGHLDWLEDPHDRWSLDEVRQSRGWTRLPEKLDISFTPSTIWLRLTVHQPHNSDVEWVLNIDGAQVDEAVLHAATDLKLGHVQRAGRLIPHVKWPIDSRTPAFRVRLAPGEHQLFLRLKSEYTLANDIILYSAEAFRRVERNEALFFGAFFGVSVVALALQLLHGGAVRQVFGRSYLAYTMALVLTSLLASGYLQTFLLDDRPMPVGALPLILSLTLLTLTRMSTVWLELDRQLPRFSKWYQVSIAVIVLVVVAWMLMQGTREGVQLILSMFVLHALVSCGLSVHLWLRGSALAGYYVLIFGLVEAGILIRFARNFGLLPINFFTDYSIFFGVALHLMAMSIYLTVRFRNMKEALAIEQKALAEQREFVGLVSHEFKTPLAIINTSAQQMAANLDAPKHKIQQRTHNIRQAVQRMDRLLDEYLSVERLDSAHQPTRPRETDFFEVIEEAVSDWPLERIRLQVGELPEPFVCDPDMMRIVLRNLLENADRHSPPEARIDLTVQSAQDGSMQITVRDHGDGIPPDERPKLFHKFFRGRASQGTPGAGLGLYLVARIVTAHHGRVSVDSTVGQGTCFIVHLPGMKLAAQSSLTR